jgi:hypothetical protein
MVYYKGNSSSREEIAGNYKQGKYLRRRLVRDPEDASSVDLLLLK